MSILLVLSALLLVVSGLVKLHAGERAGLGFIMLPLVETLAGLFLVAAVWLAWRPGADAGLAIVVCAVALVVTSSVLVGRSLAGRWRAREDSEGARLVTYVKYLSPRKPPGR